VKDLPIGMMDQPPEVVARFRKMVAAGESPRLAEMLAVRKGPCLDTDTVHMAGLSMAHVAKTAGKSYAEKDMKQARAAGIQVNENSFFNGSIADERQGADPGAWCLVGEGKDKLKKTVRDRGGACESLKVDFGESQERVDKEQARLEKLRWKKREYKKLQKQVAANMKPKE